MIGFNHVLKFGPINPIHDHDDVIITSRSRKSKWRQTDFGSEFRQVSSCLKFNPVPKKCRIALKFFVNRLNYYISLLHAFLDTEGGITFD